MLNKIYKFYDFHPLLPFKYSLSDDASIIITGIFYGQRNDGNKTYRQK